MKGKNVYLLDVDILISAANEDDQRHWLAKKLIETALEGEIRAAIAPQILYAYLSLVTDDGIFSNPLSPHEAVADIRVYLDAQNIIKIYPKPSTPRRVLELAEKYNLNKSRVNTAELVATMLDNKVKHIYTGYIQRFDSFEEIKVVNPFEGYLI